MKGVIDIHTTGRIDATNQQVSKITATFPARIIGAGWDAPVVAFCRQTVKDSFRKWSVLYVATLPCLIRNEDGRYRERGEQARLLRSFDARRTAARAHTCN